METSKKYRKQGNHPSCTVVAAINARIFHGLPDVTDQEYETLVDLAHARHGAALYSSMIGDDGVLSRLGLRISSEGNLPLDYSWISKNVPVMLTLNTGPRYLGYHTVLLTRVENINRIHVVGLRKQKTLRWIDLQRMSLSPRSLFGWCHCLYPKAD